MDSRPAELSAEGSHSSVSAELYTVLLIPAYKPEPVLPQLIREAAKDLAIKAVVVVDDGSGHVYRDVFDEIESIDGVRLIRHLVNLGKGAALKTGLNFAACEFGGAAGVVTADADGQHAADDIIRVSQALLRNPKSLVLGCRSFGSAVPARSRLGNVITRWVLRTVVGYRLNDTQTGLRGVPVDLIPSLLRSRASGYEFELDMLIVCKRQARAIVQVPIATIYIDQNRASSFNPLLDSMRIYFLFGRFSFTSLLTAAIDTVTFAAVFRATGTIWSGQVVGRVLALTFNYFAVRRVVFHSSRRHAVVFPKYLLLVAVSGIISYVLIERLVDWFDLPVVLAKLVAETTLFIANFVIERDLIFYKKPPS